MPRTARFAPGGLVYHVLNRGNGRMPLFSGNSDYAAFESILAETMRALPMRLLGYCLMPNHWHMVLWPERDGELSAFMHLLTTKHVVAWTRNRDRVGEGHVYQGRFKSVPVETDPYFYQLLRYVELNALRAGLVQRAEEWRWCSLWCRLRNSHIDENVFSPWPLPMPSNWTQLVNEPQTEAEVSAIRESILKEVPVGSESWVKSLRALQNSPQKII